MNAYLISGLGADEQMFCRIQLPTGFKTVHLAWLEPIARETFVAYAKRLAGGIDTTQPFVLIGLSLGGMMAIEMNKFLEPVFTILLSSATDKKALPWWFNLAGITRIYNIVPNYFYHHRNFFSSWLLGAKSKEDKTLLASVMLNASPVFVRWAVPRILHWENQYIPGRMKHLHGTADVILPYRAAEQTLPVEGGTHFMIFNRAAEINQQLKEILQGLL